MSFNTPQTSGRDHQTPPPFSLLFSPSLKLPDGQKHSPSALGRSPSATPAPFGFAFGPSATPGQQQHQQQTPQSRRRSLTPASSMAKDTPPPPPVDSLLDTSPLLPPPTTTTPPVGMDSGHAPEDMSTSPGAAPPLHRPTPIPWMPPMLLRVVQYETMIPHGSPSSDSLNSMSPLCSENSPSAETLCNLEHLKMDLT